MSQNTSNDDVCPTCKKGWLTHHTLDIVIGRKVKITCHAGGIPDTLEAQASVLALEYVLLARSDKLEAQKELKKVQEKAVLDKQESEAEMRREFDTKVETLVQQKVAEAVNEVHADHEKAMADNEQTRIQLDMAHDAKVGDLTSRLNEALGHVQTLEQANLDLQERLTAAERRNALVTRLENALRKRSREYLYTGRGTVSQATRIGMLEVMVARYEHAYGPLPKEAEPTVEELLEAVEDGDAADPKEVIELSIPKVAAPMAHPRLVPTPVPPAAPKAANGTKVAAPATRPAAAPMPAIVPPPAPKANGTHAAAPATKPQSVVLDDDDDQEVDNDLVIDESDADGTPPADKDKEACSVCGKKATRKLEYVSKGGEKETLNTCKKTEHAEDFFNHLKQDSKDFMLRKPSDVALMFKPL